MESILLLLALLQIKHWYIDFVDQSDEEVKHKGIYGNWLGVKHSLKHGVGTALCFLVISGSPYLLFCICVGILDAAAHYHIDWAKMNYGNRDITTKAFWNHLGMDQMAHQLTYLLLIYLVLI